MKLMFITPVYNGMPWVTFHYPEFRKLTLPWEWHVVDGLAKAEHGHMGGEYSDDGTAEYFRSIEWDKRVTYWREGHLTDMTEAMNKPMHLISEPTLLWKLDHDEVWDAGMIERTHKLFIDHPEKTAAFFWCRYLVGTDIEVTSKNTWGNRSGEWLRVWRVNPGMRWLSETSPVIEGLEVDAFDQWDTDLLGLVFNHFAYVCPIQPESKEKRYGQASNFEGWKRLQRHRDFPTPLKPFFPWVDDETIVDKVRANPF